MALTPLVPRTYKSTTTIMVEAQNVPSVYVRSSDKNQEVHAPGKNQPAGDERERDSPQIIEKFDLYPKMRKKASMAHL